MNNRFITFEGGEGSGKSTIIKLLEEKLTAMGYKVMVTREPGGVLVSEQIREVILKKENNMEYETEALLYAASRIEHLKKKVIPYLEQGYVVISDRYIDSSLAYQGVGRGLGIDTVLEINRFALDYMPKRTYFFDLKPEVGLNRIKGREKIDRLDLEGLDFHERVYQGYQILKDMYKDRIVDVPGDNSVEYILEFILSDILTVLKND